MISSAGVTIRRAGSEDLAGIAEVFLACWRTSYAGFLPGELIDMYDQERAEALWRRSIDPSAGSVATVALDRDRRVVGVMRVGSDPDDPSIGHVYSLYVHPAAQGLGVGRRLLAAAYEQFRADGRDEASLWVFAANEPARQFYARLGWRPDGTERVEPAYRQPEVRLRRTVPKRDAPAPMH